MRLRPLLFTILWLLGASPQRLAYAAVDLTASYDGRLTVARTHEGTEVAAALQASGTTLIGSLAVGGMAGGSSTVYTVQGRVRGRRVKLAGASADGARLVWIGRVSTSGLRGHAVLRQSGTRVRGRMELDRRPMAPPDGGGPPACDNAYFTDEVMPKVLVPICAHCHGAGGQAQTTSLRVTPNDPLATQASVALHVDVANPAASRILRKPLALLPHGGGQRIVAGSAEEQILRHWVDLVAAGVCGGGPGGGGPPEQQLYGDNCPSCHGSDARGLAGRPDIRCHVKIHDPVRFGRGTGDGAMPPFDNLADPDITTLQGFLTDLCDASGRTGHDLYTSNCSGCHGTDARGVADRPNVRCAADITDAVRAGRDHGAMPAYTTIDLAASDVANVQAYLGGLCDAGGPQRPADLYLSNCASCHGPTGGGGTSSSGVHGPEIQCKSAGDISEKVRFGEENMPAFPALSAADISAITAYLHAYCTGGVAN